MKLFSFVCLASAMALAPGWSADVVEPQAGMDLDNALTVAASYESGQSREAFRRIEEAIRSAVGDPIMSRQVEAGLMKLLAPDTTFEAKKFACIQLGIIGSPAALPALARLLGPPETTALACLALAAYPQGKADELLRDALGWANDVARIQIINTIGDRHDLKAVAPLSRDALAADPGLAEAAIAALGKIQAPAACKAIAALKGKANPALSGAIAEATLRAAEGWLAAGKVKRAKTLYEELLGNSEVLAVRRRALSALLALDNDGGEARILATLSGPDPALRPVAIAGVSRVTSPWASDKFAAQLPRLKPEEQALLLESLAARDDDSARLALAKGLSSQEPLVRRAAIVALGKLGDPYFSGMLARTASLAADPEENRALEAALVGLKGGAETDQRLVAELKTSSPKPRILLIGVVVRRQGAAANPLLLEETANTDPAVAKAAFRALAKSATVADAPPLLAKLVAVHESSVRTEGESAATQVLERITDPSARSLLVLEALSKATTVQSRLSLIRMLPTCGDATALAALKTAAADPELEVRDAAVRALAEWPDVSAREALLEIYRRPGATAAHGLALRGLVRLAAEDNAQPDPALVGHYRALITGARGAEELRLILGALGGYGNSEALPLVLPMLSDPAVRPEAIVAVKRIAEAIKAQNPQLAEEALKRLPAP